MTQTAARLLRLAVQEVEAAWDTAYESYKRAKTRKGWKSRVKGPQGDLRITPTSVSLDGKHIESSSFEVEEAIWHLTQLQLGLDPISSR